MSDFVEDDADDLRDFEESVPGAPGAGPLRARRRDLLKAFAALGAGAGAPTFHRALAARAAEAGAVTPEMIEQAEWIAGLKLSDEERASTAKAVGRALQSFEELRRVEIDYDVPPALTFFPAPPRPAPAVARRDAIRALPDRTPDRPAAPEDLAFLPVTQLALLVRNRLVSSTELTRAYLDRLKRFDPLLKCVVTLLEKSALEQAARADREIAEGHYRGPLHGVPWGAKDLIAFPGHPTTWGAPGFRDRVIDVKASVVERLEAAGAVLVAKLSLGALASGDRWFGGQTRSPWDPRVGSSGSSAGSASAVAAGLVGFAIGSETHGSIISPCRACGATGLRPTFGRVSRYGCMTLAWSMDKLGPIARSVEDCALVFDAIHGADERDPASINQPFDWPAAVDLSALKIGYVEAPGRPADARPDVQALRALGFDLAPIRLPDDLPIDAIALMLGVEAATVFDELTREHVTEGLNSWPVTLRRGHFVPAVEYLRAARVRTRLMHAMAERMAKFDLYIGSGPDLTITNLTGHPSVVFPWGFHDHEGRPMPGSITLTGRLYEEATLLAVARAVQQSRDAHLRRPPLEQYRSEDLGSS